MSTEHPAVERQRVLEEGAVRFAELRSLLDARTASPRLHAEGDSDWNSRDVYAHFARWIGFTTEQMQRKAAGLDWLPPMAGSDDEINERWAAEDRALTLEQARDWCIASTETLKRLMNDLSVEQWKEFGSKSAEDIGGDHYKAHIDFIRGGPTA